MPKSMQYNCNQCAYNTSRKFNFERHLITHNLNGINKEGQLGNDLHTRNSPINQQHQPIFQDPGRTFPGEQTAPHCVQQQSLHYQFEPIDTYN